MTLQKILSLGFCWLFLTGASMITGGGGGVPSAGLILVNGACPAGYTELVASQGRYLVATPAAGTQGGTLGSAMANQADVSYTPAGTNGTPTFTGNALSTHAHTTTVDTPATNIGGGSFGSGATMQGFVFVPGASAPATAGNLTNAVGAGTPSGTNTAPSFTGTAATTMRSTVSPYIQLRVCQAP